MGRLNIVLVQVFASALGWSSEKWSKASGRATVGWIKFGPPLSASIPIPLRDYIKCDAQSRWNFPDWLYQ
jgi:hypothetical protein